MAVLISFYHLCCCCCFNAIVLSDKNFTSLSRLYKLNTLNIKYFVKAYKIIVRKFTIEAYTKCNCVFIKSGYSVRMTRLVFSPACRNHGTKPLFYCDLHICGAIVDCGDLGQSWASAAPVMPLVSQICQCFLT